MKFTAIDALVIPAVMIASGLALPFQVWAWLVLAFVVNYIVGIGAWLAIDPSEKMLRWIHDAPLAIIAVSLIQAWPIGIWLNRRRSQA